LQGQAVQVPTIITLGRDVLEQVKSAGVFAALERLGVQLIPDICWCSITQPVFPAATEVLMTNSGKYAHYADGLTGRGVRFGALADCAQAALSGLAPTQPPDWLAAGR